MSKLLDAGEQGERDWLVVTGREPVAEGNAIPRETSVMVRAIEMSIVDGALVFRDKGGELSWVFGPGGWLEVSRA